MVAASDSVTIELWIDQLPVLPGAMAPASGISSTWPPPPCSGQSREQVHALKAGRDHSSKLDPALETLLIDPRPAAPYWSAWHPPSPTPCSTKIQRDGGRSAETTAPPTASAGRSAGADGHLSAALPAAPRNLAESSCPGCSSMLRRHVAPINSNALRANPCTQSAHE